ncbi:MAG: tRNA 4-thiouridine(8) synthase ThiI [Coriobacteriaceae bacterium]|jgi:thiamine biosynthesis protein ThiI|nr:tRNA 4-thiouridine(8) synthase ThiI [Coriobacteriaceae bacterium]
MFQRVCLVHYHEIGLKGHNRASFEVRLLKNIEFILASYPVVTIKRISGRLCVFIKEGVDYGSACALADRITHIPGVARVSCGFKCPRELEAFYQAAGLALSEAAEARGGFESFKVSARRNHTDFAIDSLQMNQLVGAHLCNLFPDKAVRMKQPDITVSVEVVQSAAYVYARSLAGVGGLPVGSSGRVICLLSAGIDSPVALWRLAKRGAVCLAVHFSGRPQTSAASEHLVEDIARVFEASGCIARIYVVPFGDHQRQIAALVPPGLRVIMYRRLMMKVAEALAAREHAQALVTGESLGQVASQTLENLAVTDAAVSLPVFRPLIGTDKQEIIDEAQRIGTFAISSQDAPDCCTLFMPRSPETHAKLDQVIAAESLLPLDEWIPRLVEAAEPHDYACAAYRPH